jgi:hypothetical protein
MVPRLKQSEGVIMRINGHNKGVADQSTLATLGA